MENFIRRAVPADLAAMMSIVTEAQAYLKAQGLDQWQNGYPDEAQLRTDINAGEAWVAQDAQGVAVMGVLQLGEEASYGHIEGAWAGDGPYGTIHRVATAARARQGGLARALMHHLEVECRAAGGVYLRVDTHPGNLPMQRFLQGLDYTHRGTIYLDANSGSAAGNARLAYDKPL